MGIEVALIMAAVSAVSSISAANKQAKQVVAQGEVAAMNKAKEVNARTARAQANFLNSGLSLEGTPMAAIQGMYDVGLQDVKQLRSNVNSQAKNIIAEGRNKALSALASSFAMASFAGGGAPASNATSGFVGGASGGFVPGASGGIVNDAFMGGGLTDTTLKIGF